mmetsp:Transcript_1097/g.2711  ORF Transcript_1097/g.2711 Transcript_1097/m.2711 type:complete len:359 (-) Transcript_1097:287-1363(-)
MCRCENGSATAVPDTLFTLPSFVEYGRPDFPHPKMNFKPPVTREETGSKRMCVCHFSISRFSRHPNSPPVVIVSSKSRGDCNPKSKNPESWSPSRRTVRRSSSSTFPVVTTRPVASGNEMRFDDPIGVTGPNCEHVPHAPGDLQQFTGGSVGKNTPLVMSRVSQYRPWSGCEVVGMMHTDVPNFLNAGPPGHPHTLPFAPSSEHSSSSPRPGRFPGAMYPGHLATQLRVPRWQGRAPLQSPKQEPVVRDPGRAKSMVVWKYWYPVPFPSSAFPTGRPCPNVTYLSTFTLNSSSDISAPNTSQEPSSHPRIISIGSLPDMALTAPALTLMSYAPIPRGRRGWEMIIVCGPRSPTPPSTS